jgi:hypothetical protein
MNNTRIPAGSMLRWLVERNSAPLQMTSPPAAGASATRRRNNAA